MMFGMPCPDCGTPLMLVRMTGRRVTVRDYACGICPHRESRVVREDDEEAWLDHSPPWISEYQPTGAPE